VPLWLNNAGAWKNVKTPYVNNAGTWKPVKTGWVNSAGVWKKFFSGSLIIAPAATTIAGGCAGHLSCTANTNTTFTVSGGSGVYTVSLAHLSGDTYGSASASMSGSSGTVSFSNLGATSAGPATKSAVYRVTVSDGSTSAFYDLTVNTSYLETGGGGP
jgi:hypothetical protein